MTKREVKLEAFAAAAKLAFEANAKTPEARRTVAKIFSSLQTLQTQRGGIGKDVAVSSYLTEIFSQQTGDGN